MNSANAARVYLLGTFMVLCANVLSVVSERFGGPRIAFYHLELLLTGALLVHVCLLVLQGQIEVHIPRTLRFALFMWLGYTVVSALLLLRYADISVAYVGLTLHSMLYFPVLSVAFLGFFSSRPIGSGQTWKFLALGFMAIVLFGLVQLAAGETLIHIDNADNVSKLVEANQLGRFRPPSIFESSFQFGLVCCAALALALPGAFRPLNSARLIISGTALIGILATQTRNTYLMAAGVLITLFALRRLRAGYGQSWVKLLPLILVVVSLVAGAAAVVRFVNVDYATLDDLSDASSVWARVSGWLTAWETQVQPGNWFDLFFGYGIAQAGQASDYAQLYPARAEVFIDSTYVGLFLYQGLTGLTLFLITAWSLWKTLLRSIQLNPTPMLCGTAALLAAFFAAGLFNILYGQWWGIILGFSLVAFSSSPAEERSYA